jgi:hypothetical protein
MIGFDPIKHKQEQERNIITRKIVKVPDSVSKFITELLIYQGKRSDYFRTCITCLHWKQDIGCSGAVGLCDGKCDGTCLNKGCALAGYQVPPPEVIVDGCNSYEDEDIIPF